MFTGTNWTDLTDAGATTLHTHAANVNSFETIAVSGQSNVVADSATDTLTLTAGTNVTITTVAGTDTITINSTASGGFTLGTEQASTSGTAISFTGIPAGTKIIHVHLIAVSTSGASPLLLQLCDAGGFEVAGYTGRSTLINGAAQTANGSGFRLTEGGNAGASWNGLSMLSLEDSSDFTWTILAGNTDEVAVGQTSTVGAKALSQELTQVRVTTVNGSDTFDAGVINISYIG
jgi:hypothetical protein